MAVWQSLCTTIVRHLIDDLDENNPRYSDNRIQQAIVIAGLMSAQEFPFSVTYSFDVEGPDILPDPGATETYDGQAVALFTLKAACILDVNRYQNRVGTGVKVTEGDASVDLTTGFKGYVDIITLGPCASYTKLLADLQVKSSMSAGKAVLGPFSHSDAGNMLGGRYITTFFNSFDSTRR